MLRHAETLASNAAKAKAASRTLRAAGSGAHWRRADLLWPLFAKG